MKIGRWSLTLCLVGVVLTPQAQGVVEQIQVFYERTKDIKGQFSQRVELAMGQVEEARGAFISNARG